MAALNLRAALGISLALCGAGGCGCGTPATDGFAASDAGPPPSDAAGDGALADASAGSDAALVDLDADGLDDALEQALAEAYFPYLSLAPDDACPLAGIVFRLRPHPLDAAMLHVLYDVLYELDCGAGGHAGDDEVFALTVDPGRAGPGGILAMRAISHQGTPCESVTDCGCAIGGLSPCTTAPTLGDDWPVVFSSRDKHGSYLDESTCDGACFFTNQCELAAAPTVPPMVNAGEPGAPLTSDLTAAGLITAANGWTDLSLFGFDPWGPSDFGGAGNVAGDLVDPAFETPVPGC